MDSTGRRRSRPTRARPPCILIVEEEADIVDFLRAVLREAGFQTAGTSSRREGIAIAREASVDLFIVDLGWYGSTRLELVEQLRAQGHPNVPAIGMSASPFRVALAWESGQFAATLDKPFDIEVVLEAVRRITGWQGLSW